MIDLAHVFRYQWWTPSTLLGTLPRSFPILHFSQVLVGTGMDKHSTLLLGTWLHSLGQSWCGAFGSLHTLPIRRSQCVITAFAASLSSHVNSHPLGFPVSLGDAGHTDCQSLPSAGPHEGP
ncbi:hypothetical protein HJG60_012014 [Phyllostomus discolor]|uniref:Uncharacterized protein n=1 Tax=Phyllostomus discolor TaxID=89673 RepID=A0A833ZJF9_9CHIR|nr:hypothetical protein HJG60_012014 [Phyllostomus discolor]